MFYSMLHNAPHAGSVMPTEASQGTRCRTGDLQEGSHNTGN